MKNHRSINGWLVLDKPLSISSAAAVGWAKRLLGGVKIGHAGTLDPLASGVLPLALGEATKAMSLLVMQEKSYQFSVSWGAERSTDDAEGEITHSSGLQPTESDIRAILPEYLGLIQQVPPSFSTIQQQGKRAYDAARSGTPLTLAAREVRVDSLELLAHEQGVSQFLVKCGKGVYVRSLARDMGRRLGCYGYVSFLRRLSVGPFTAETSVTLEKLEELGDITLGKQFVLPIMGALGGIPALMIEQQQAQALRMGQMIPYGQEIAEGQELLTVMDHEPVAIVLATDKGLKPRRVFVL